MALNIQDNVDSHLRALHFCSGCHSSVKRFHTHAGYYQFISFCNQQLDCVQKTLFNFTHPSWVSQCGSVLHYQPDYVQRIILICGVLTHHILLEPPCFKETWEACAVLGLIIASRSPSLYSGLVTGLHDVTFSIQQHVDLTWKEPTAHNLTLCFSVYLSFRLRFESSLYLQTNLSFSFISKIKCAQVSV